MTVEGVPGARRRRARARRCRAGRRDVLQAARVRAARRSSRSSAGPASGRSRQLGVELRHAQAERVRVRAAGQREAVRRVGHQQRHGAREQLRAARAHAGPRARCSASSASSASKNITALGLSIERRLSRCSRCDASPSRRGRRPARRPCRRGTRRRRRPPCSARRSAASLGGDHRRLTTTRSMPARSRERPRCPPRDQLGDRRRACPAPTSSASSARLGTRRPGGRMTSRPSAPANSAGGGSWRRARAAASRRPRRTAGWRGPRRRRRPVEQVGLDEGRRPARAARAFARATVERVGAGVAAGDVRSGRSCLSASATAPLPVHASCDARALRAASRPTSTSSSVSGRGTSTRASTCEVDVAEALRAEQVGDGLAPDAAAPDEVLERAGPPGPRRRGRDP